MSTTRPPAYDQAPGSVEASRRGAHRARAKPALAGLPILAGLLVVAIAAGGAWYVLDSTAKDSSASVQGAVGEDDGSDTGGTVPASAGASPGASASATTTAEATTPAAATTGNGGTSGDGATVNRSAGIRVLNSVPVAGLAARVAADLTAGGWTISGTGNSKNKNLVTTKVYYGKAADKATAEAAVKDLGYGITDLEPTVATTGLIVVLGQDAE